MVYSQILNTCYHPELLKNDIDRRVYLSRIGLGTTDVTQKVVRPEYMQLLNGDIPYFLTNTSSKKIYFYNNELVDN